MRSVIPAVLVAFLLSSAMGASPAHAAPADPMPAGENLAPPAVADVELPGQVTGELDSVSAIVVTGGGADVVTREVTPQTVDAVTAELEALPGAVTVSVDTPVALVDDEVQPVAEPVDPADLATAPVGTDPFRGEQWALDDLGYNTLPADAADGSDQLVAVLDTGVMADHKDLTGVVRCDLGADFAPDAVTADPAGKGCVDPHGHGTHVVGEISAVSHNRLGIEGGSTAPIMPVRVLSAGGDGTSASVASGIIYAVDHGATVINMSLAGAYNPQYNMAVKYATDRNVVVVAAAGNNRAEGDHINYPAASPGAIAVAASDDTRTSTYFSYSGPTNLISAPGWSILSTDSLYDYVYRSGTSMAAPLVAAVLARYRERVPTATVAEVRDAVISTAIDLETPDFDDNTGYGLINGYRLITGVDAPQVPVAPPGAPTGLSVTPGDSAVSLGWTAPDLSSLVTGYTLQTYRGATLVQTVDVPGNSTSAVVTGLSNGTAYTFTVTATNAVGAGPASARSASVTPAAVPAAPLSVTAKGGDGSATVSWAAAVANGSAVTGYTVTASPGGATASTTGATSVTVPGLTNGTAYMFTVTATNAVGTSPASTRSAAVTPKVPVTVPGAAVIGQVTPGAASATVTWTAPASTGNSPVTGYTVRAYRGASLTKSVTAAAGATSAVVTGLSNGTAYTFAVSAKNAVGAGPASVRSASVTPAAVPAAPLSVTAKAGDGSATVSWAAAVANGSAVTGYTVTASPGGATASTAATSAVVTGLTNGTAYTFTVTARNAVGSSPASARSSAVRPAVPVTIPGSPSLGLVSAGAASAKVSWTAPASDGNSAITGYVVKTYRGTSLAKTVTAPASGTSATVTGLVNGTAYTVTVSAKNVKGVGPATAASAVVTPAAAPAAPKSVKGVKGVGADSTAKVSWAGAVANGSAVSGYTVTASPGGATASTTGATSVVVTGLTNGTSYTFTVTATNAIGTSVTSARSLAVKAGQH